MSVTTKVVNNKVAQGRKTTQVEKVDYQLVHCTLGRFRIRIPRLAEDSEYANKLRNLVESLDSVTSVRINPAASSLVVEYDRKASEVVTDKLQKQVFNAIQTAPFAEVRHLPEFVEQQPSSHKINHQESAARFFKAIQENEALKVKLQATNNRETFVKIAAEHGYNFTVEELEKLSPEELAAVMNPGVGPRWHLLPR